MFVELIQDYLGNPIGKRIDVDEKDAQHLIAHGMPGPSATICSRRPCRRRVEGAFQKFTQALDGIVSASLKQFADAQKQVAARTPCRPSSATAARAIPKKCFGDFCLAVARNDRGYLEKHYGSVFNAWHDQGGPGRIERRHRRLHRAARVLPSSC